jgi:hypothetical protein
MIYLLGQSPYNEDFLLEGYCLTEDDIKNQIVQREEQFFLETPVVDVDWPNMVALAKNTDGNVSTYYIIKIPRFQKEA